MKSFDEIPSFAVSSELETALAAALWEAGGNNPEDFASVPSLRTKQKALLERFMTSDAFQRFAHELVVADRANTLELFADTLDADARTEHLISDNVDLSLRLMVERLRGDESVEVPSVPFARPLIDDTPN